MDSLDRTPMERLKKRLDQNCTNSNLEYRFNEKTGQLLLSKKQEKKQKKDKSIDNRFEILDL